MLTEPNFPGRAPIDAYGNGGFRFAEMSHRGSIMVLPSGFWIWPVDKFETSSLKDYELSLHPELKPELLLIGTGLRIAALPSEWRETFRAEGVAVEAMDTGAAARTYNVLLAEQRSVGAALIAV